jgi:hypothetical protein
MPDTNVLIEIRKRLDDLDHGAGLVAGPLWSSRDDQIESLRDLIQLWWWRDVRFLVHEFHLSDAKKPLSEERRRAREDAVRELGQDFFERGGDGAAFSAEMMAADEPCALHSISPSYLSPPSERGCRWPKSHLDRRLVKAAFRSECRHVFLTMDKDILRSHESLFRRGLAIMTPTRLIEELDDSGELDAPLDPNWIVPDLSALTRLYSGFGDA